MKEFKDFIVEDMPGMLSRVARILDPNDSEKWIVDDTWKVSRKQMMSALFEFYKTHGLLRSPESLPDVEKIILKLSDFTELGQRFIMSAATHRWLKSFDRPGTKKKYSDVSYLEKQLAKLMQ